jgi:uncharacterized membrane protein YdfJ with MMPL/SSD domain
MPGEKVIARAAGHDDDAPVDRALLRTAVHDMPLGTSADIWVLKAEIDSLREQVRHRRPWTRKEVEGLLDAAEAAGIRDARVEAGRAIHATAMQRFVQDLRTKNRLMYAFGMLIGLLLIGTAAVPIVSVAGSGNATTNLAEAATLVSLFTYAGLGSLTSFLTRLPSLDLSQETSRRLVFLSAASRPVVAISFASVVYLILRYRIVNLAVAGAAPGSPEDKALWWLGAFLCGFSERFASDLLGRVPLLGSGDDGRVPDE